MLQTAFGWEGDYLHEFTVHGVDYGTTGGCRSWGVDVRLADLGLRERERFGYAHNFFAGWRHELRVEKIGPVEPRRRYPRCLTGARQAPPEDCDGPAAYLRLRAERPLAVARIAEILGELLDMPDVSGRRAELQDLAVYAHLDDFDRKAVNRALDTLSLTWSRCGTTDP